MEIQLEKVKRGTTEMDLKVIIGGLITFIILLLTVFTVFTVGLISQSNDKLATAKADSNMTIKKLKTQHALSLTAIDKYKSDEVTNTTKIEQLTTKVATLTTKSKDLQANIDFKNVIAKKIVDSQSKDSISNMALYSVYDMPVDEMNKWLAKRAPKGSPFINKGESFIKAASTTGLNPLYLAAHAGLESQWGMSNIGISKNNYYGIGAYNTNTSKAYTFSRGGDMNVATDKIEIGIIEGAKWIEKNYTNKGQDTLYKMIYGNPTHTYCVTDAGVPDPSWISKIATIMTPK